MADKLDFLVNKFAKKLGKAIVIGAVICASTIEAISGTIYGLQGKVKDFYTELNKPGIEIVMTAKNDTTFKSATVSTNEGYQVSLTQTAIDGTNTQLPSKFSIGNYPNPWNEQTNITISIEQAGQYTLRSFDLLGRELARINKFFTPGDYIIPYSGGTSVSGMELLVIEGSGFRQVRKIISVDGGSGKGFGNVQGNSNETARYLSKAASTMEVILKATSEETQLYEEELTINEGWNDHDITLKQSSYSPTFNGQIESILMPEDSTYQINLNQLFSDLDTETLEFELLNAGEHVNYQVVDGIMTITLEQDWNGTIEGLKIKANDGENYAESNEFNLNALPVNDAPRLTLETVLESVGEDTTGLPIAIANFTIFDPDTGRDGYFDIYLGIGNSSGNSNDIILNMDGSMDDIMEQYQEYSGQIFLESLVKHSNGYKEYGIEVYGSDDWHFSAEEYTKITVEPRDEPIINVTFRFKAAYPDTLLETGVNTLQLTPLDDELRENPITEFQEISVEDNACITASVSSLMNVNGINSNSADGRYGKKYLFLKKGSAILEQRADEDTVSVVDFGELADGDTVDVYKMMEDYQIEKVVQWLVPFAYQGTRIFPRGSTVTVWWNTRDDYKDPDSTYLAWTKEAMDHLTSLPNVEYNYQLIISDGPQPAYPVLEIIWDPHLSTPQNITSYNVQNEITKAQVRTTDSSNKSNFLTELWEGTTNSYESGGQSPLVTELDENNDTKYNAFGDELYSINYLGLPNTKY
ncbi:MAG: hypothetical protein KKF65_02720 [Nanoarchaeota archaeon]|nr:hypothetical protein [Nanoarchaeota archaeon]